MTWARRVPTGAPERERGQSIIEIALALPLLLVAVLGLADLGRVFFYTSAVTNAAREGAMYAARNPTAKIAQVGQRACDETGLAAYGQPCPNLRVSCSVAQDAATVEVLYDFALLSGYLSERLLNVNPITIRAASRFPLLSASATIPCSS